MKRLILILNLFALCVTMSFAQSRSELEARRKQLLVEINETNVLLTEARKQKNTALQQYLALQKQVRKRKQLIHTLEEEIRFADLSMERAREVMTALEDDVERLKEEYTNMIRIAYRQKMTNSALLFLFSSQNLNEAFKRWQYLKQYNAYRQKQAALIIETQQRLLAKASSIEERKKEKESLLVSSQKQASLLNKELKSKNDLLKKLKNNESTLAVKLNKRQEAHEALNSAIEQVIFREMAARKKAARNPMALNNKPKKELTTTIMVGDFKGNKGRLPWPVSSGFISRRFGTQAHPTLKEIEITNNGIDISTDKKAKVRAVFEGKVASIQFVPGYQNTIILQHGNYYTVYSNLENVLVKKGDFVSAKQQIGTVGSKKAEVHFEVWHEKQRLNPVNWVSKN